MQVDFVRNFPLRVGVIVIHGKRGTRAVARTRQVGLGQPQLFISWMIPTSTEDYPPNQTTVRQVIKPRAKVLYPEHMSNIHKD